MKTVRRHLDSFLRKLRWYRVKIFGRAPVFNPRKDPIYQDVLNRQNAVIAAYREKFGEDKGRLLDELLKESWASPDDYREEDHR